MKRTFIFKLGDNEISPTMLRKLVSTLQGTNLFVSWRYDASDDITSVQIFAYEHMVVQICFDAGWNTIIISDVVRQARRNGDAAVGRAELKFSEIRRAESKFAQHGIRYSTPMRIEGATLWMSVTLDRLRKAGCDIKVYLIPPMSYEIVVFGETFTLESSSEARGFLAGLEKGLARRALESEVSHINDEQFLKNLARLKRLQMPGGTKRSKRSA